MTLVLFLIGLYWGLVIAPPDYQMGDSYRIIFIHVPCAWLSLLVYVVMAGAGGCGLLWRVKIGHTVARCCAPIGAVFTFAALVSGALWGKPSWGTYWLWDARLTSELILLFLYLGYLSLLGAIPARDTAARAAALLALVGLINIPIIHYSVVWWHTLHQGATIAQFARPSIDTRMLIPLLIMFAAMLTYFASTLMLRIRHELLNDEQQTQWVKAVVQGTSRT